MQERTVHLTAKRDEYIALLDFCLVGIGAVLYLLWAQLVTTAAVVTLPLLSSGVLFSLSKLRQVQPEYILTEQGIRFAPYLRHDWISWAEITAITPTTPCDSPPYVQLQLKPDATYWITLSPMHKQFLRVYAGGPELVPVAYLYTAGLTMSHEQIIEIVQRYWQQQKDVV